MKVVIDIDDDLYTRLFDNGVDIYDDAADMAKAIRKGTPLPEGLEVLDLAIEVLEEPKAENKKRLTKEEQDAAQN